MDVSRLILVLNGRPRIPLSSSCPSDTCGVEKVLGRDEAAKKPPESAVVASAVAFMGPKWRRPPVFYFSSMMAADTEKLATDSSLSTHPASVSACMALPQAREARPQTWEARPPQTLVARYDAAATVPVPACSPPCWRGAIRHSPH